MVQPSDWQGMCAKAKRLHAGQGGNGAGLEWGNTHVLM